MAVTATPAESTAKAPVPEYVARFPMSYEAFLAWDHEGGLAEWVNGEAYLYMSATELHQRIVGLLFFLLQGFVDLHGLGRVLLAPFGMRSLPDGSGREPDILFVDRAHLDRLKDKELAGPADLVIEVVSEDSPRRDRSDKFDEYQDAGVREYWIIDARPKRRRVDFYVLDAQNQYQPAVMTPDNAYHSTVLPGFWFSIDWLWREDPNPIAALTAIVGAARLAEGRRPPPPQA